MRLIVEGVTQVAHGEGGCVFAGSGTRAACEAIGIHRRGAGSAGRAPGAVALRSLPSVHRKAPHDRDEPSRAFSLERALVTQETPLRMGAGAIGELLQHMLHTLIGDTRGVPYVECRIP